VTERDKNVFVTHVLSGRRFDDASVPVEVLPDLAAYRQLVVAVARAIFFRRNTSRQRVPKGFEEQFQLVFRKVVEPGSAAIPLERKDSDSDSGAATPLFPFLPDVFDEARDLVSAAIDATATGKRFPAEFPIEVTGLFNAFGATLRPDEHIVLLGPKGSKAVYDRTTRKKLVLMRDKTYEDDIDIVASIAQFDRPRMLFEVLSDERRIPGRLEGLAEESFTVFRNAVAQASEVPVRIVGRGAFDGTDRLVRFVKIDEITYAEDEATRETLDVRKRLAALGELQDGWFDGDGVALDDGKLSDLADHLMVVVEEGVPRPYLYPLPEGAVLAEWPFSEAEVSAEFNLFDDSVFLVGTHVRSRALREERMSWRQPEAATAIARFVSSFGPEGLAGRQ
jgi:hypothetical protein